MHLDGMLVFKFAKFWVLLGTVSSSYHQKEGEKGRNDLHMGDTLS